jgi:hypothetical protein
MVSRRTLLNSMVLATAAAGTARAADSQPNGVPSRFAFEARVTVAAPVVVGTTAQGMRRIVPITGGTFAGPRLSGRVVPGGADWQVVRADGVLSIEAKYTLEVSDGTLIMVTNRGMRHGPPEVIEKLTRGETVSPELYYFRTCAEFEAPLQSKHAWLNRALFIGVAERQPASVIVRFHELI